MVLHGIALCDHSQVGSAEWWASGVPGRHAARAGLSLAEWAERQGMVIPTPTALRDASARPNPELLHWSRAAHGA